MNTPVTAAAPGKIILFGEHAVVYSRPALAAPVSQVSARVTVTPDPTADSNGGLRIQSPAINLYAQWDSLPPKNPARAAIQSVLSELNLSRPPACTVRITSSIPVSAGLGSGAAVSIAILRAFSAYLGSPLPNDRINALAYEIEKLHHGTPSGIDNTVITYNQPVFFIKGQPIETFQVPVAFTLLIADTGIPAPTAQTVGGVRQMWQAKPQEYERYFSAIGKIARQARKAIESGAPEKLGALMDENHFYLQKMGVSCPELDNLVRAARKAGAFGAKLSGGGGGGNLIALIQPEKAAEIASALEQAGAARVIVTEVR